MEDLLREACIYLQIIKDKIQDLKGIHLQNIYTHQLVSDFFVEYKIRTKEPYRDKTQISDVIPFTINRRGYKHLFVMSPNAINLTIENQNVVALAASTWTIIPNMESIKCYGPTSNMISLYYVCTNDIIP